MADLAGSDPNGNERPPALTDGFVAVGVVLTSFGLKGEIKVEPLTDFPARFAAGHLLYLDGHKRRVTSSRWQQGIVFIKLTGIETPEEIAPLRGHFLELPEALRPQLPAGEYYQSDLIGMAVFDPQGEELGRVDEILETGANDVLVVHGERGEILLPVLADVVLEVQVESGRMTVEVPDGLMPEPKAIKPPRRKPPWLNGPRSKNRPTIPGEGGG